LPPAYDYLVEYGSELESVYPYVAADQSCKYKKKSVAYTPKSYVQVPTKNGAQLAAAVTK